MDKKPKLQKEFDRKKNIKKFKEKKKKKKISCVQRRREDILEVEKSNG